MWAKDGAFRLHLLFRQVVLIVVFAFTTTNSLACESLEACIAEYPHTAVGDIGIQPAEKDLAERVVAYGSAAIPHLIRLLEHEDVAVRELAGFTISYVHELGPEHLEPLVKARKNGAGWLPPAIARIGTPEAIDFLVKDFREHPCSHCQASYAFKILGAKGAPHIAELFACVDDCSERLFEASVFVLNELGEDAVGVIPRLLEIAEDDNFALISRRYALASIGEIGFCEEAEMSKLLSLRDNEPHLELDVGFALLGLRSPEAVSTLLKILPNDPIYVLSDITSLGANGYEAGPAVLSYLDDTDWDVRVAAANTLGHIGYKPASPSLAALLAHKDDWKLVYAAISSLGRMRVDEHVDDLAIIRGSHWYPPVRELAGTAIQHIRTGKGLDDGDEWRYNTAANSPDICESVAYQIVYEPPETKLYETNDSEQLMRLSYETKIYSYGAPEGTEPNDHGIVEVTTDNMVEYVKRVQQIPQVALKVPNGWLVGSNRGEWGGELVYVNSDGNYTVLYDGNIEDIFPLGDSIVATSGIAHMFFNEGMLLRIDDTGPDTYNAVRWKRLPSAPASSWPIKGNKLLVNSFRGGSIVFDSDGTPSMADCVSRNTDD